MDLALKIAKLTLLGLGSALSLVLIWATWSVERRAVFISERVIPVLDESTLTLRNARKSSDLSAATMVKLNANMDRLGALIAAGTSTIDEVHQQIVAIKIPLDKTVSDADSAVIAFNTEVTAFDPGIKEFNSAMREADQIAQLPDLPAALHNVNLLAAQGVVIASNLATTTRRADNIVAVYEKRVTQPQSFWKTFATTVLPIPAALGADVLEMYRYWP
jgi:hypothetical protein